MITSPSVSHRTKTLVWALLILAAITLVSFLVVDYGNFVGIDEWSHTYTVYRGSTLYGPRPLAMGALFVEYQLVGTSLIGAHIAHLFLKFGISLLVYLLVRHFDRDAHFALACGSLTLLFTVPDWFVIQPFQMRSDNLGSLLLALIALLLYFRSLEDNRSWLLVIAIIFAVSALLMRESVVPVLIGAPVIETILVQSPTKSRARWLVGWIGIIALASLWYARPFLGLGGSTYGQRLVTDLNPLRMARDTLWQFMAVFRPLLGFPLEKSLSFRLPILITIAATLLGFRSLPTRSSDSNEGTSRHYLSWLIVGIAVTVLGFAAFLPTGLIAGIDRIHTISIVGEAIIIAAFVCAITQGIPGSMVRLTVQNLALVVVALYGVQANAQMQQELYYYDAIWDEEAIFVRSLANQMPVVKENTLFVLIQDPSQNEAPFISGWGFEYAMRYLYEDRAAGLITTDNVRFHSWKITKEGIEFDPVEDRLFYVKPEFYHWDEMIFVTRATDGSAIVLGELPEKFHTPERSALYNPDARVERGFIPSRIRELLPPIRSYHLCCQSESN